MSLVAVNKKDSMDMSIETWCSHVGELGVNIEQFNLLTVWKGLTGQLLQKSYGEESNADCN